MVVQVPPHDAVLLKSLNQGFKKAGFQLHLKAFPFKWNMHNNVRVDTLFCSIRTKDIIQSQTLQGYNLLNTFTESFI